MYKIGEDIVPCCTSLTMKYIGSKWKTVILHYLKKEPLRYSELRKKMPTVTERTLSLQLKQLHEDGLINRKVYTQKPPMKVEYSFTKFGETLIPLLDMISEWGQHVATTNEEIELIDIG